MSDLSRKRMLAQYEEDAGSPTFLANSFFPTTAADIHDADTVEMDIRRDGRPISIVVTDWKSGGNVNTLDLYTNKEFTPPILKEVFTLNTGNLGARQMGETPFENPNYMAAAQRHLRGGVQKMTSKIRRTVELQAAQILQTGVVTLIDAAGATRYSLDFDMKSTHKPNASVDWDETTADPLYDLGTTDELIRKNGKRHTSDVIFGDSAWDAFLENAKVQALLDNRRIELGGIAPTMGSEDQVFMGTCIVNGVKMNLWTYKASYDHPQTGADTKYVSAWNVIMVAKNAPRRLTYGGIPRIVPIDPRVSALGVGSVASPGGGIAVTTNAWVDPEGTTISASVATRPLAIPVAIDCHACINAKAT